MNANIRKTLLAGIGAIVIGVGSNAWGGAITDMLKKAEDSGSDQSSSSRSQPAPAPAPAPNRTGNAGRVRDSVQAPSPPPAAAPAPRSNDSGRGNSGSSDRGSRSSGGDRNRGGSSAPPPPSQPAPVTRGSDGGVIGGTLQRNFGTSDRRDDRRDDRRGDRYDRNRPSRVVTVLPPGYRDYYWNGSRYYFSGGYWYQPYGSSYISIGVPYGLFVGTLPGYYTSFWYGGTRYFYADDTYFLYEPARRGYVVARSPYESEDDRGSAAAPDDDLFIYPAQGQSEQQQADDRYECHRWAVDQTDYDPIDDEYDRDQRADYLRAMTACLTGRGYSVR